MAIIQSYGTNISVATNDLVPFATNAVLNGRVMHDNPTVFNFNKSGIYSLHATLNGSTTDAGTFGAQVLVNGVAQPQSVVSVTSTAGGNTEITLDTLIELRNCLCQGVASIPVSVQYTGSAGTLTLANVIIERL